MSNCWLGVASALLFLGVAACSSKNIPCGGRVYPSGIKGDALSIAEKAMAESKRFCAATSEGCDYIVAKTPTGWSVAATRVSLVDEKCLGGIGDERFYSYDNAGELLRTIDGL